MAALEQQIEERHAAELAALEQQESSSKQEAANTDAPVKPIIQGLYEIRLAPQEASQVTQQPCMTLWPQCPKCSHDTNVAPSNASGVQGQGTLCP